MRTEKEKVPYGLWHSPITPEWLSQGKRLNDIQFIPNSEGIVWSESFSGKTSLMVKFQGDAPYDLSGSLNPAGGVGYGGGEFFAGVEQVVFSEKNGRLYSKPYGPGPAKSITPGFGNAASPVLSPDGRWVMYVLTYEGNDVLALVDSAGERWPAILSSGADFYMQPVFSPAGDQIAWVEWNHPHMPWEETSLCLAKFDLQTGKLMSETTRLSSPGTVFFQPAFSPDGQKLAYLTNHGNLDELIVRTLAGQTTVVVSGKIMLPPAWVQGIRSFGWSTNGEQLYFIENSDGGATLNQVELLTGNIQRVGGLEGYTVVSQPVVSQNGTLALLGESSQLPERAILLTEGKPEIVARSQSDSIDPAFLPTASKLKWTSADGYPVYGLYYPPTHPSMQAEGAPPVIVYIHGGPTSQAMDGFASEAAYFTSRGYAYFAVNYRGSSGYGRDYLQALNGRWGEVDVQDTISGCAYLISQNLADPHKLVIKGGSSGGYTVLNALVRHPGFFKAGLCSYGVSNLFLLDMDTHKFEAHYTHTLVGALPEAAQKYHDWSPVFHADQIQDALAVFQGKEDKVVSPYQSESIVEQLQANRIPHVYRLYEGEGHGFRKSETILDCYNTMDRFLKQYVIFRI